MLTVAELKARLSADTASFSTGMRGAERTLDSFEKSGHQATTHVADGFAGVENAAARMTAKLRSASSAIGRSFTSMATTIGVATGGLVSASLFKGFDRMTTIENSTKALGVALGDTTKAAKLLDGILEVVRGTPFNLDQFAEAGKNLVAFGSSADKVPGYLRAIGEAAAASGGSAQSVQMMVDALGDATSQGKMTNDTLGRLSQQGVPALKILANAYGVTGEEMFKMVSKGAIPAEKGIDILTKGIMEGSTGLAGTTTKFAGTMAGLRTTLTGALGGLSAAGARFGAAMLKPFSPIMVKALGAVSDGIDKLAKVAGPALEKLSKSKAMTNLLAMFEKAPAGMDAMLAKLKEFAPALAPLVGIIASIASTQLSGMLGPLGALVPKFGLLTGAIAGLAAANPELRKSLVDVGSVLMSELKPVIPQISKAFADLAGSVAWMIKALVPAVGWVAKMGVAFTTKFGVPIIKKVSQAIYDVTNMLGGFYRAFKSGDVESSWNPIMAKASELGARFHYLWAKAKTTFDTIMQKAGGLRGVFRALMPIVAGFVALWVDTKLSRGVGKLTGAFSAMFQMWKTQPILAAIELIIAAFTFAYIHVKPFRDVVDDLGRAFINNLGPAITTIRNLFSTFVGSFKSGVANLEGSGISDFFSRIGVIARNVWDGLQSAWSKVGPFFQRVFATVGDAAHTAFGWLVNTAIPAARSAFSDVSRVIGGTIIPALGNAYDAARDFGGAIADWASNNTAFQWVADKISDMDIGIGDVAISVGTVAAAFSAWETLGPVFMAVVGWVNGIRLAVIEAGGVTAAFQAVMASTTATAAGMWAAVTGPVGIAIAAILAIGAAIYFAYKKIKPFRDFIDSIWQGMQIVWDKILDGVSSAMGVVSDIWQRVTGNLSKWWKENGAAIEEAAGHLWVVLKGIFTVVGAVIIAPFYAAYKAIMYVWDKMGPEIIDVVQRVWTVVQRVWNGIWQVISGVVMTIVHLINGDWRKAWDSFVSVLHGVGKVIWAVVREVPGLLWDLIKGIGKLLWHMAQDIVTGIWNACQAAGAKVEEWLSKLPGFFWGKVKDAGTWLYDAGKNIVEGLLNGIKKAWGAIWNWMKGKLSDLWNGVLDFFGIASPSKKMAWVGDMMMHGLAKGIEENRQAEDAMDKKAQILLAKATAIAKATQPPGPLGGDGDVNKPRGTPNIKQSTAATKAAEAGRNKMNRLDGQGPSGATAITPGEQEILNIMAFFSKTMTDEQKRAENYRIDDIVREWKNKNPYGQLPGGTERAFREGIRRMLRVAAAHGDPDPYSGASTASSMPGLDAMTSAGTTMSDYETGMLDAAQTTAANTGAIADSAEKQLRVGDWASYNFATKQFNGPGSTQTGINSGTLNGAGLGQPAGANTVADLQKLYGAYMQMHAAILKNPPTVQSVKQLAQLEDAMRVVGAQLNNTAAAIEQATVTMDDSFTNSKSAWEQAIEAFQKGNAKALDDLAKTLYQVLPKDGKFNIEIPALPAAVYSPAKAASNALGSYLAPQTANGQETAPQPASAVPALTVQGNLVLQGASSGSPVAQLVDKLQDFAHLSGGGLGTGTVVIEGN